LHEINFLKNKYFLIKTDPTPIILILIYVVKGSLLSDR